MPTSGHHVPPVAVSGCSVCGGSGVTVGRRSLFPPGEDPPVQGTGEDPRPDTALDAPPRPDLHSTGIICLPGGPTGKRSKLIFPWCRFFCPKKFMFLNSFVLHFISWLLFFAWFILSQMSLEELLAKPKRHWHLFASLSFAFCCFGLLAHCTRLLTALDASRCTALALLPASLERKRILSNFPRNSQKVGNSKMFTCFLD